MPLDEGYSTGSSGGGEGGISGPQPQAQTLADYVYAATELVTMMPTQLTSRTHTFTLGGTHARTISINTSDSINTFNGPWVVTGTRAGQAQVESVTLSQDGSENKETLKTFDPGTITVDIPGQRNTFGSYTITVGDGFGLSVAAHESEAMGYAGHLLSLIGLGFMASPIGGVAGIAGPTVSPPYGKLNFLPGNLVSFAGDPIEIVYLKA